MSLVDSDYRSDTQKNIKEFIRTSLYLTVNVAPGYILRMAPLLI